MFLGLLQFKVNPVLRISRLNLWELDSSFIKTLAWTFNFTWSFHLVSLYNNISLDIQLYLEFSLRLKLYNNISCDIQLYLKFSLRLKLYKNISLDIQLYLEFSLESKPYRCGKDGFYIENTNIFTSIYFKSSLEQEFDQS